MSAGSAGHTLYQEAKANDHGVMTMNDVVKLFKNEKGKCHKIMFIITSLNLYHHIDIAYFDFFLTTFQMDDKYGTSTKNVKIQEGYETDTSFGLQFNSGKYNFLTRKFRHVVF